MRKCVILLVMICVGCGGGGGNPLQNKGNSVPVGSEPSSPPVTSQPSPSPQPVTPIQVAFGANLHIDGALIAYQAAGVGAVEQSWNESSWGQPTTLHGIVNDLSHGHALTSTNDADSPTTNFFIDGSAAGNTLGAVGEAVLTSPTNAAYIPVAGGICTLGGQCPVLGAINTLAASWPGEIIFGTGDCVPEFLNSVGNVVRLIDGPQDCGDVGAIESPLGTRYAWWISDGKMNVVTSGDGTTFSKPVALEAAFGYLAFAPDGSLIAIEERFDGVSSSVWTQTSVDGVNWSGGVQQSSPAAAGAQGASNPSYAAGHLGWIQDVSASGQFDVFVDGERVTTTGDVEDVGVGSGVIVWVDSSDGIWSEVIQ